MAPVNSAYDGCLAVSTGRREPDKRDALITAVPPFVLFERRTPPPAVVTLNNPARLNALHTEMVLGLHDVLDELAADSPCRVVIFTGAGRGFCSGLDLSEPAVGPTARDRTGAASGMRTQEFIASLVPKIIALPRRLICASPAPARASRAAELIYTARRFDAYEAERIGFVSEVVAEDDLLSRAEEIASVMLSYSPFALAMTKQVFRANQDAANVGCRDRVGEPHAGTRRLERRVRRGGRCPRRGPSTVLGDGAGRRWTLSGWVDCSTCLAGPPLSPGELEASDSPWPEAISLRARTSSSPADRRSGAPRLNVVSTAAFMFAPFVSIYAAGKSALTSLTRSTPTWSVRTHRSSSREWPIRRCWVDSLNRIKWSLRHCY